MRRITALVLAMLVMLFPPPAAAMTADPAVELLRLAVPQRSESWLEVKLHLAALAGADRFLGRDLYWDPVAEQGCLSFAGQS